MKSLGKSLDQIPFDKIYKGMKVAFKANLDCDNYVKAVILNTKRNCLTYIDLDNLFSQPYDIVELEFENGPIYSMKHHLMSNIFFME